MTPCCSVTAKILQKPGLTQDKLLCWCNCTQGLGGGVVFQCLVKVRCDRSLDGVLSKLEMHPLIFLGWKKAQIPINSLFSPPLLPLLSFLSSFLPNVP